MTERRRFTREFKISAVKLVNEQGYTPGEAAKSLGVSDTCVRLWVAKLSSQPGLGRSGESLLQRRISGCARRTPGFSWSARF